MTAHPDSSGSHIGSHLMRVLVLAPQPFFINRGTPIDVLLVLRALVGTRGCPGGRLGLSAGG
jgi:hypothetical protein